MLLYSFNQMNGVPVEHLHVQAIQATEAAQRAGDPGLHATASQAHRMAMEAHQERGDSRKVAYHAKWLMVHDRAAGALGQAEPEPNELPVPAEPVKLVEPAEPKEPEVSTAPHVAIIVRKLHAAPNEEGRRDIMRAYIRGASNRKRREALADMPLAAPEYVTLYKTELRDIEQEEYEAKLRTQPIISGGVGATAGGAVALIATGKVGWAILGVLLGAAIGYGGHYFYISTQNGRILKD